jgi:site-specific DNA recombinase
VVIAKEENMAVKTSRTGVYDPQTGLLVCDGHVGLSELAAANPTSTSRNAMPQYRCSAQRQHGPACPKPSISASMIDPVVWDVVTKVLRHPQVIADEVAKHRQDGGLERQLVAVEKRLAAIMTKHQTGTKRLMSVDDHTADLLSVELKALSDEMRAAQAARDSLLARIADQAEDVRRVQDLEAWAETVAENLDMLTYDEKRLALDALGVKVHAYRFGTVDAKGEPYPRWVITLEPTGADPIILYGSPSTSIRACCSSTRARSCCSTLGTTPSSKGVSVRRRSGMSRPSSSPTATPIIWTWSRSSTFSR